MLANDPPKPSDSATATEQPEGVDEADEARTYTSSITVDESTLPDGDEAAEAQTLAILPGLISQEQAEAAATAAVSGSVKVHGAGEDDDTHEADGA